LLSFGSDWQRPSVEHLVFVIQYSLGVKEPCEFVPEMMDPPRPCDTVLRHRL